MSPAVSPAWGRRVGDRGGSRATASTAKDYEKQVEIRTYEDAPHAFCNETRKDTYRPEAALAAWEATVAFLNDCFKEK